MKKKTCLTLGFGDVIQLVELLSHVWLQLHALQRARLACISPSSGVCSDSYPLSVILDMTPNAWFTNFDRFYFIKVKTCLLWKVLLEGWKATDLVENTCKSISDQKNLLSRLYKEHLKLNNKKEQQPNKKVAEYLIRDILKKMYWWLVGFGLRKGAQHHAPLRKWTFKPWQDTNHHTPSRMVKIKNKWITFLKGAIPNVGKDAEKQILLFITGGNTSRHFLKTVGISYEVKCNCTIRSDQIRSVAQSCPTLCDPMNRSTPGLPVHHQLPQFTQTHLHRVSDAIQPSHPLSSPSPPAPNPSQHQGLFQWINSSHEVAKVLELQL